MWYYIHLGDVEIRRTSTLKTASRVGNLNLVNYGFKNLNGANSLRDDVVAFAKNATADVKGFFAPQGYSSAYAVA